MVYTPIEGDIEVFEERVPVGDAMINSPLSDRASTARVSPIVVACEHVNAVLHAMRVACTQ